MFSLIGLKVVRRAEGITGVQIASAKKMVPLHLLETGPQTWSLGMLYGSQRAKRAEKALGRYSKELYSDSVLRDELIYEMLVNTCEIQE